MTLPLPRQIPTSGGRFGGVNVAPDRLSAIRQIVRDSRTLSEAQTRLREIGMPTRRQTISQIRQIERAAVSVRGGINRINLDTRPGVQNLIRRPVAASGRFTYTGTYRTRQSLADETLTKRFSFPSNEPLTRRQIETQAGEIFGRVQASQAASEKYDETEELDEIEIDNAYENLFA